MKVGDGTRILEQDAVQKGVICKVVLNALCESYSVAFHGEQTCIPAMTPVAASKQAPEMRACLRSSGRGASPSLPFGSEPMTLKYLHRGHLICQERQLLVRATLCTIGREKRRQSCFAGCKRQHTKQLQQPIHC